jgi:hypothetical protein
MAYIKTSLKVRLIWMAQPMANLISANNNAEGSCPARMAQRRAYPACVLVVVDGKVVLVVVTGLNSRSKNQEAGKHPPGQN